MTNKKAKKINKKKKRTLLTNSIRGLFLCMLLFYTVSSDAGTYLSTKHGDSTDGVDRSVVTSSAYPDATNTYPKGHCGHCHEQHTSIDGSEPTLPTAQGPSKYALFKDNDGGAGITNELCHACHEQLTIGSMTATYGEYGIYQGKTKYNASIHGTSASMNWSPDASPPGPPFGPNSTLTDDGNCHNCHNPHGYDDGSGLVPHMLFARDSATGDSPAYEMGCEACHDGTQATEDVQTQMDKTYAHPTHTYNNRHTLPENGTSFETRHAECVDCHNPHTVQSGTHTAQTDGNAVSNVLSYVWGVEPTWPAIWTKPVTFTERKPPTYTDGALYEYQICFKCHSNYGLGTVTNGVSTITGPSGTLITDQAWEFNPNNKSAHPVVVTLNNQTGSYAPKALNAVQLKAPWNADPGNQTMYCSDCHGADDEATSSKGPHGSSRKYMLKGTGQYWPTDPSGTLWEWGSITDDLFCRNCHPLTGDTDSWTDHDRAAHGDPCVYCHVAVPHGSQRSRLIGYNTEVAPYNYNGNSLEWTGFRKTTYNNYDENVNCEAVCRSAHGVSPGPAD